MTELIKIVDTMSSVQIAELTGKQHAHVMRDIRNLLSQGVHESNFGLMYKISKLGNGAERKDPYYELTKKGCLILASGYDAKLREKIIDRWEELENEKRMIDAPSYQIEDPIERAEKWIKEQHERKRLALENEQIKSMNERLEYANEKQSEELKLQAPKVKYHDEVLTSTSTYNTTNIAKEFGTGAPSLNKILHEKGVQYKSGGQWLLYSKYQDRGYTRTVTNTYDNGHGEVHTRQQTVWTEKGRQFIHSLLTPNTVAV